MNEESIFFKTLKDIKCQKHQFQCENWVDSKDLKKGQRIQCKQCPFEYQNLNIVKVLGLETCAKNYFAKKDQINQQLNEKILQARVKLIPLLEILQKILEDFNSIIKDFKQQLTEVEQSIKNNFRDYLISEDNSASLDSLNTMIDTFEKNPFENFCLEKHCRSALLILQSIPEKSKSLIQEVGEKLKVFSDDIVDYGREPQKKEPQQQICNAIAFNSNDTVMANGCGSQIQLWDCENDTFKRSVLLNGHSETIWCLCFSNNHSQNMKDFSSNESQSIKDFLVSGSSDKTLIVWEEEENKKCFSFQCRLQHLGYIRCVITDSSYIISSSNNSIFVWCKDIQNQWTQKKELIGHQNQVYQLSFTKKKDQFVSCSYDKIIIIWQKENNDWTLKQKVQVNDYGYKVCFINENQIAYQQIGIRKLLIYEYQKDNFKIGGSNIELSYINTDLDSFFPMIFNEEKQLLLLKHNKLIYLIRRRKNNKFYIEQKIEGDYYGTLSNDASKLVLWDKNDKQIKFFQLKKKTEISYKELQKQEKQQKEQSYLQSQLLNTNQKQQEKSTQTDSRQKCNVQIQTVQQSSITDCEIKLLFKENE